MTTMAHAAIGRWTAFGIHLGASLLVFLALLGLLVFVWYPGFLFDTDGGWQGMRIIIAVDVILGPLLTLVVYRPGKPGLWFDMTCILLLQAGCLAAGTWVVASERPIAVIHVDGAFYSMSRDAWRDYGEPTPALSEFRSSSSPPWIDVELPADLDARSTLRRELMQRRVPMRLWTPGYRAATPDRLPPGARPREAVDLTEIPRHAGALTDFLDRHGGEPSDYLFYPFHARYGVFYMGFHRDEGTLAGLLYTDDPVERDG